MRFTVKRIPGGESMAVFTQKLPEKEIKIELSSNRHSPLLTYPPPAPHKNPSEGTVMTNQSKLTPDQPGPLTDLQSVVIQGNDTNERLTSFLAQVEDPYQFRVGDTTVRISYRQDGRLLHDILHRHFMHLKQGYITVKLERVLIIWYNIVGYKWR